MTQTRDDTSLIDAIRQQDAAAWEQLIARFEGRLLAFADSRLQDRAAAEDVVQETFLGFLLASPNYDPRTPLESFLFAICAHKLTDALRRRGVRPRLLAQASNDEDSAAERVPSGERKVSSLARSQERRHAAERVLGDALQQLVGSWLSRGEFERLRCAELLFVAGRSNKTIARDLGLSEQAVANHKSFIVQKLKAAAATGNLRDEDWRED